MWPQGYRGFESHPLRQNTPIACQLYQMGSRGIRPAPGECRANPTLSANFQNSDFGRLLPRPCFERRLICANVIWHAVNKNIFSNYFLSANTISRWEYVFSTLFQIPVHVTRLRCAQPSLEPNTSAASAFLSYISILRTTKTI